MATKRERNGAWHYTIKRKGLLEKPIYFSFENEAEGDAYARQLESLLDRGVIPEGIIEARATDLRSALIRYQREVSITGDDEQLLRLLMKRLPHGLQLVEISYPWAERWVSAMKRERNLSPSTIRHYVGALSRALNWLAAHGEIPSNPLVLLPRGYSQYTPEDSAQVRKLGGDVKEDDERDRRLLPGEEEEIRRLLAGGKPNGRQRPLDLHHKESLALLFDMALETAMRLREMYSLEWGQVDLSRRTIFLDKTKNGDKRQVPMSSVITAALERYKLNFDGRVFPWMEEDGKPVPLNKVTSKLSRQFARLFDAAGCEDLRFHDLRHEGTSRFFERTELRDTEIMRITGHRDPKMLKRYANLRGSELATRLW